MTDAAGEGWSPSFRRVWLIAGHTLNEALRLRLAWLLAGTGAMLVLLARGLRDFNFGAGELRFIADFGLGAIGLLGTLLAVLAPAHLFFNEVAAATIGCMLARSVRRGEYIAGKLIGAMALLTLHVAGLGAVLVIVLAARATGVGADAGMLLPVCQACGLVWCRLTLVAAMTLLVCSYAGSALFASWAGCLLAVVAHLRPFAPATGTLAWLRLWPNLGLFDVEAVWAEPGLTAPALAGLVGYWSGYLLLFGFLAAHVFKHREF